MRRFSKARVTGEIQAMVAGIQERHGFDPEHGWAQVRDDDPDAQRNYGAFTALELLAERLGVEMDIDWYCEASADTERPSAAGVA